MPIVAIMSEKVEEKTEAVQPSSVSQAYISEDMGKKLPNLLTLLRIIAVPIFVLLLVSPSPSSRLTATIIFVIASITDWLDGYIARLYKAESILGTLLDPLADKVLVMSALVMLSAVPSEPRVPAWMVVALLARELLVTGLRSLAAVKGIVVAASNSAKWKTAVTLLAIFFLLVAEPYSVLGVEWNFFRIGMFFLWISLILSLSSGMDYAIKLKNLF
jgi:CDP-diacylglycerol---glycerol-3-phosphate 3-phosphatidyltransferase